MSDYRQYIKDNPLIEEFLKKLKNKQKIPNNSKNLIAYDFQNLILYCYYDTHLYSISLKDAKLDGETSKSKISYDIDYTIQSITFEVIEIKLNIYSNYLSLIGEYDCNIVELSNLKRRNKNKLELKSRPVGSIYKEKNSSKILNFQWHPHSSTHFGILSNDRIFRLYNSNDVMRAEQIYILDENVSSFCFSTAQYDFHFFSVYFLVDRRDIYVLCPVIPENISIPFKQYLSMKRLIENKSDKLSRKWIDNLLKVSKKDSANTASFDKKNLELRIKNDQSDEKNVDETRRELEILCTIAEKLLGSEIEQGKSKIIQMEDFIVLEVPYIRAKQIMKDFNETRFDFEDSTYDLDCKFYEDINLVISKLDFKYKAILQGPINEAKEEDPLPENVYGCELVSMASKHFDVFCLLYNDCVLDILITFGHVFYPKWEKDGDHNFAPLLHINRVEILEHFQFGDENISQFSPQILWDISLESHIFYVVHNLGINQIAIPSISSFEEIFLSEDKQNPTVENCINTPLTNVVPVNYDFSEDFPNYYTGFCCIFGFGPLLFLTLDKSKNLDIIDLNEFGYQENDYKESKTSKHKKKFLKIEKFMNPLKSLKIPSDNLQVKSKTLDANTVKQFDKICDVYYEKINQLLSLMDIADEVESKHYKIMEKQEEEFERIENDYHEIQQNNQFIDDFLERISQKNDTLSKKLKNFSNNLDRDVVSEEEKKFRSEMLKYQESIDELNKKREILLKQHHLLKTSSPVSSNEKLPFNSFHGIYVDLSNNNKKIIHLKGRIDNIENQFSLINL